MASARSSDRLEGNRRRGLGVQRAGSGSTGSISASNNDNMSSRNCVADVDGLGGVTESSGVISMSSRVAGGAVGSVVS